MGKDAKVNGPIIVLRQGDKAAIPVKAEWIGTEKPNLTITAEAPLQNAQSAPVTAVAAAQPTKEKPEVVVNLEAKTTATPGPYSIVLRGVGQVPFNKDPMAKQKAPVPDQEFAAPIPVFVVPSALARLTMGSLPGNTLKVGTPGEIVVKVDRQHDFAGEIRIAFSAPMGTTGISAGEATIPAGANEAKLIVKAAAGTKPGPVANATITATALYDGKYPIVHEAKVSFTVVEEPKKKDEPKKK
jgi:hypothetical protein